MREVGGFHSDNSGRFAEKVIGIVRQERLNDAKRERLIEAAIQEFSERGIERASYNKIIERSGLSKGTVYYYFDNKDSLLYTVLEVVADRFVQAIGDFPDPSSKEEYWETAWEYHERIIRFFLENPSLSYVLFKISGDKEHTDERAEAIRSRLSECMNKMLAKGRELGVVRDDLPIRTIMQIMQAVGVVLRTELFENPNPESENYSEETMRQNIRNYIAGMHDISTRLLAPREECAHA